MAQTYRTPLFSVGEPVVCHSITLRASLWGALFDALQTLGSSWSWRQDDPTHATVQQVIDEFNSATDKAVFSICMRIGAMYNVAGVVQTWELVCDGSTYDRVDYPELYDLLGANYHIDADTFVVPDLIDRFPLGSDTPGIEGGSDEITLTQDQLPPHAHTYEKSVVAVSNVLGTLNGLQVGAYSTELTGSIGVGDAISIINPYHTVIPVIVARRPS